MRRALVLLPWFDAGGSEVAALDVLGMLRADGWRTRCVASLPQRQALRARFEAAADAVDVLPERARDADAAIDALGEGVDGRPPELVLASNSDLAYELLPWLRLRWPHAVLADLNHLEAPGWRHGGFPAVSAARTALLDLQMAVSDHLRDWMVGRGADPRRTVTLHLHADPDAWRPDARVRARLRAALGLADDEPVLLFAGRLVDQKQPLALAAAVRALRARAPRFVVLVAGDGERRDALADALAQDLRAGSARLLGTQPPERIRELMQSADVLVLPSASEGIALVLFEAMACGLAVVATDVGGQRELVTPEAGVLLAPGDDLPARLADALERVLGDAEGRAAMRNAARRRIVEAFTPAHTHARLRALVDAALAAPRRPTPPAWRARLARRRAAAGLRWDWALSERRAGGTGAGTGRAGAAVRVALRAGPFAALQALGRRLP